MPLNAVKTKFSHTGRKETKTTQNDKKPIMTSRRYYTIIAISPKLLSFVNLPILEILFTTGCKVRTSFLLKAQDLKTGAYMTIYLNYSFKRTPNY